MTVKEFSDLMERLYNPIKMMFALFCLLFVWSLFGPAITIVLMVVAMIVVGFFKLIVLS